jgi:hypothetical protein
MEKMPQTAHTPMLAEVAQAGSADCRRLRINGGAQPGATVSLAERCAR